MTLGGYTGNASEPITFNCDLPSGCSATKGAWKGKVGKSGEVHFSREFDAKTKVVRYDVSVLENGSEKVNLGHSKKSPNGDKGIVFAAAKVDTAFSLSLGADKLRCGF